MEGGSFFCYSVPMLDGKSEMVSIWDF
jgi:hypothetical protein